LALLGSIAVFCSIESETAVAGPHDPTTVPGTIDGRVDVTLSGSTSYSIALRIPPGAAGTEPKIAFVYDSQSSPGPLGAGWSISGLSKITRGPKNLRTDGLIQGVHFDASDALYLDGQRLIATSPGCVTAGSTVTFVKEADDQTIISGTCQGQDGIGSFVVRTKAGLTMYYGATADSQVKLNDGKILLWVCNKIQDSSANYITFEYVQNGTGDYNIAKIDYTGNSLAGQLPFATITFNYQILPTQSSAILPTPSSAFIGGYEIRRDRQLTSIVTAVGGVQASRYDLHFQNVDSLSRFLLKSITESGAVAADISDPPKPAPAYSDTTFAYSAPDAGSHCPGSNPHCAWAQQPANGYGNLSGLPFITDNIAAGYRVAKIAGQDGTIRPQILYGADLHGVQERAGFQNSGGQKFEPWNDLAPPVAFNVEGVDTHAVILDLDGDGHPYLIAPNPQQAFARVWHFSSKWDPAPAAYQVPMAPNGELPQLLMAKVAARPGPGADLLWSNGTTSGTLINQGPLMGLKDVGVALPARLDPSARAIDVDCDGVMELSYFGNDNSKTFRLDPVRGWIPAVNAAGNSVYDLPQGVIAANVFADAIREIAPTPNSASTCPSLLIAQENGYSGAFTADPQQGWQADSVHNPSSVSPPIVFADKNGNSLPVKIADNTAIHQKEIVASRVIDASHTVTYAYLLSGAGFNALAQPPRPTINDQPLSYLVDLNNDGWPDLVYFANTRNQNNASFLYKADNQTWSTSVDVNFTAPVAFARQGQSDLGVRLVNLHGPDGRTDIIYRQDKNGAPVSTGAYTNNGSAWADENALLAPKRPLIADYNLSNVVQFVDVDSDGFTDMLYSLRQKDGTVDAILFRNVRDPSGNRKWDDGTKVGGFAPPIPFGDATTGDLGVRFADLDGDGRPDIVYARKEKDGTTTHGWCKNDGSAWQCQTAGGYTPPADLAFVVMPGPYNGKNYAAQTDMQLFDVDGDGLPDLVFNYTDAKTNTARQGVCLNTGKGWPSDIKDCSSITVPIALDTVERDPNVSIQYIDINGDGLVDIVKTGTGGSQTFLGTGARSGAAWLAAPQWNIPTQVVASTPGDPGFRLIDVNGDGLPDILFADGKTSITYFNNGTGWIQPQPTGFSPPTPLSSADGSDLGIRLIDVNGDGLPDLVLSYADANGKKTTGVWLNQNRRADVLVGVIDGLGVRTTICYQALGELTDPNTCNSPQSYADPGALRAIYDPCPPDDKPYPILCATPSAYVARKVTVQDGGPDRTLTYSYRYSGLRFDLLSRQLLGFASRTATDEGPKHTATTMDFLQFDPTDPLKDVWNRGLIDQTVVTTQNDKIVSRVKPRWQHVVRTITPDTATPANQFRSWTVSEAAMHTESNDLDGTAFGTEDDVFTYDQYLNVISSVNTRSDQTSVKTVNEYFPPDTAHWILGRLKSSTVTKIGDPKDGARQTETRKATFEYAPETGLLTEEVSNSGQQQQVTADYTRDKFGNIVRTVLSAHGEASRTLIQTYDHWGRFVVLQKNAAGHVTERKYSDTLGSVLSSTDPNGLITSFLYDGFGRVVYRKDPTTVETRISFQSLGAAALGCPAANATHSSAAYTTTATTGSLPPVTTWFDCRGRPVDIMTAGFSGNAVNQRSVIQHTDYDVYGRIVKMTRPYFAGDPNPPTIERDYDALDRVTLILQPRSGGQAVTVTLYKGLETTILDALQHKTVIETNVRNLPVKATDPNGNTSTYSYDAGDRLTGINATFKDDHGKVRNAVTTHKYDNVGHREMTIDPDLGEWHYRYNAFGDLVWQKDAIQNETKITYDSLDRPLTRTTSDREDSWRYDTAPGKGIGSLKSVSSEGTSIPDAYSEEYQYDDFGRQSAKTVQIKNKKPYTSSTTYDAYGRIAQTHEPGNFGIRNVYDSSGYLAQVVDGADGKVYWQAQKIDPLGRVTQEKFGNDVQTVKTYDAQSAYLTGIDTTQLSNGKHIQSDALTYDLAGNLKTLESINSGRQQTTTYAYDNLQRLISVQPQGLQPQSIKYDAAGGITAKPSLGYEPGTGSFNYDDYKSPFHAVKSIKTSAGSVEKFQYDQNGNLTQKETVTESGTRNVIWLHYTVDNRVKEIGVPANGPGESGGGWEFEYTASGQLLIEKQRPFGKEVEITNLGLTQIITEEPAVGWTRIWRHYLTNSEGVFAVVDTSAPWPFSLPFSSQSEPTQPDPGKIVHFLHKDHLGSVERISDDKGAVATIFNYDVWGYTSSFTPATTPRDWSRGYTGHEETANAFFVHMNGRVYDPSIGQFTSPDLMTQVLTDSRTFNRYSYVLDNPLKYTDPTGYFSIGDLNPVKVVRNIVGGIAHGLGQLADAVTSAARWVVQNWKEVVVIAAAICVTVLTAGTASPILVGLLVGATTSGLSTALYGGSFNDVLRATVTGAIFGAISGGIGEALSAGSIGAMLAKGGLGGIEALAQGGNVWQGIGISALSDVTPDVNSIGGFDGAAILRIGAQAALSGTISLIEGGKFGNGAMYGAFAQLQADSSTYNWRSVLDTDTAAEVGAAVNVVRDAATLVEEVKALPLMAEGIVAGAVVSTVSKFTGFNGNFQYNFNVGFARDQMSTDPFTVGVVTLGAPNAPRWSDAREYGVQGMGTAVFGGYSFQLAPTGNISGTLGLRIEGPPMQQ
jgi:RHS repeat-associated protein